MRIDLPRLLISGLAGSSGKTLLSLGLTRAFTRMGLCVQPCKKGPDYIDAAWLGLAAKRPAANLDPWFLPPAQLRAQFFKTCFQSPLPPVAGSGRLSVSRVSETYGNRDSKPHLLGEQSKPYRCVSLDGFKPPVDGESRGEALPSGCRRHCDLALIEGNRGLYDGRDVEGECSSAQVARALEAPVILTLNCAKMTRTAAALVLGVKAFDPELRLAGVVLNNTGSERHATQVRQAIERYTDLPVLGALPRMRENPLPERQMGLTLHTGSPEVEKILERLADYVSLHCDLEAILTLARQAGDIYESLPSNSLQKDCCQRQQTGPLIGYVDDDALWFYYRENLDALVRAGARLVRLSIVDPAPWPALDGLYLGGGFPELYAEPLSRSPHLAEIRNLSEAGKPVYAECGGFMVLGQSVDINGINYTMSGVLPVLLHFSARPQGLGYVEATVIQPNPFHPLGATWRGHEFHYSRCETMAQSPALSYLLRLSPGTGMAANRPDKGESGLDGLCVRRTFAGYTHLYAPAVPHWATNFVAAAYSAMPDAGTEIKG